jgi:hypothetical protein
MKKYSRFFAGVLMILFFCITQYLIVYRAHGFWNIEQRALFHIYAHDPLYSAHGHTIEYPIGAWFYFKTISFFEPVVEKLIGFNYFRGNFFYLFSTASIAIYIFMWYLLSHVINFKNSRQEIGFHLLLFVIPFLGYIYLLMNTFDLLPAGLAFFSAIALIHNKKYTSAILLAIATSIKWFPAILFPIFFLFLRQISDKIRYTFAFFTMLFAIVLAGSAIIPLDIQLSSFSFHGARGIHHESLYGNVVGLIFSVAYHPDFATILQNGAMTIVGAPFLEILARLSFFILLTSLASIYILLLTKRKFLSRESVAIASCLSILSFILFSKVLSPQFIYWLLPFIIYIGYTIPKHTKLIVLYIFALALSMIPPFFMFQEFVRFNHLPYAILSTRNILLLSIYFLLWKSLISSMSNKKK